MFNKLTLQSGYVNRRRWTMANWIIFPCLLHPQSWSLYCTWTKS